MKVWKHLFLAILMSSVAFGVGDRGTANREPSRAAKRDDVAKVLLHSLAELQFSAGAKLNTEIADSQGVTLSVTDRSGASVLIDLAPNATSDVLRPGVGARQEVFGRGPEALFLWLATQGAERPAPMQPLDESTASIAHDDVTVLPINEDLLLVVLWQGGEVIGIYYAVDTDSAARRIDMETAPDRGGTIAATQSPREVVCGILYECCRSQCNTYWVFACGFWLWQCDRA